jgi:hypothetical protein
MRKIEYADSIQRALALAVSIRKVHLWLVDFRHGFEGSSFAPSSPA